MGYLYLAVINAVSFLLYGIDKKKAIRNQYRIPEATLLLLAFVGGALGAWIAMRVFHHKTRKIKFSAGVPALLVFNILAVAAVYWFFQ